MNYSLQDFFKYIIPGLYTLAFAFGWYFLSDDFKATDITGTSSILVLLIPFVGFVVGYCIECVMSVLEHTYYLLGGRRPSKTILTGCTLYHIKNRKLILSKNGIKSVNCSNKKANEILQAAKQSIARESVEGYRNHSVLARNIFGSQAFLTISYAFIADTFYCDGIFFLLLTTSFFFFIHWCHNLHVYIKYVLAEYSKTLEQSACKN